MEYPAMLYKPGTMFQWDHEWFDCVVVTDQDELEIALADGWVSHKPTTEEEAQVVAKEPTRRKRKDAAE